MSCYFPAKFVRLACALLVTLACGPVARAEGDRFESEILPILEVHCYGCHGDGGDEGNFQIDAPELFAGTEQSNVAWWSVAKNVRAGLMPPAGEERLSDSELRSLMDWIYRDVWKTDPDAPDPGRVTLRRLNREEYRNTIRDLMGIEFDTGVEFPPDDSGNGFDNNADALSISPLLAEKYLAAASSIVRQAVPETSRVIPTVRVEAEQFGSNKQRSQALEFDREHRLTAEFDVTADATYRIAFDFEVRGSFNFDSDIANVRFLIDEEAVHEKVYRWQPPKERRLTFERRLDGGRHQVTVEVSPVDSAENVVSGDEDGTFVKLDLDSVTIEGPLDPSRWIAPENYDRFFHRDQPPANPSEQFAYAREVLQRFSRNAYRRSASSDHLDALLSIAGFSRDSEALPGDQTFESRISRAMTAVLASPRFLFRVETPVGDPADRFPLIDEHALAVRLSYFLWSTSPDEELTRLADEGKLRENLDSQIDRMIDDERFDRFLRRFVGQWLQSADMDSVSIDTLSALGVDDEYRAIREYLESTPTGRGRPREDASAEHREAYARYREIRSYRSRFDDAVRRDMATETRMSVAHVMRENRSLLELIDCDYAFLNDRLARHYGIEGVEGDQIKRVSLPADSVRGGVLTQGTFLAVTSNPTRTSPVKRGLFILDNILGTPAPPAPAQVPELEESAEEHPAENPTLRELLEIHRSEALCRSCHARFDPLGLALENFSAIGTWRDDDRGAAIEPAGELITGETFQNVKEMKRILASEKRADFFRCVAERMLTYSLGRSLDYRDEVVLDQLVGQLERNEGKARTLIRGVIRSAPFQRMRRPDPTDAESTDTDAR